MNYYQTTDKLDRDPEAAAAFDLLLEFGRVVPVEADVETTKACRNCDNPSYQHGTATKCQDMDIALYERQVTPWVEVGIGDTDERDS